MWGGTFVTFFSKSCWNLWNFLLYTLGVKKCISLLLFREHGEINYFLSMIYKLLLLLIITIIIIYYFRLSTYDSRLSTLDNYLDSVKKRGKKSTAWNQNKPCRNIWLDKFQVKGDYFLPERFDLCEEIFNGVLKCSPVVGFKCRGLSNI